MLLRSRRQFHERGYVQDRSGELSHGRYGRSIAELLRRWMGFWLASGCLHFTGWPDLYFRRHMGPMSWEHEFWGTLLAEPNISIPNLTKTTRSFHAYTPSNDEGVRD